MFTGIVEETGIIKNFNLTAGGAEIEVKCAIVLNGTRIGDSISIDGVCETVTELNSKSFKARVSEETLRVTNFSNLKIGQEVNLERALTLNSRLGGHIVSGHVDCRGKLLNVERLSDFYNLTFEIPHECTKYVVYKGSVAVNGISLTVAEMNDCVFNVAVIPHTYSNTNMKNLSAGDIVNIETDILGKYVEKMLSAKDNKENHISVEFLAENGFV